MQIAAESAHLAHAVDPTSKNRDAKQTPSAAVRAAGFCPY